MQWFISNPKMALRLKNKKGFTLIELMVTILIIFLIFAMVYSFMSASGNFFNKNSARADAHAQSRLIFEGIKKEVGTAKGLVIVGNATPVGIHGLMASEDSAYFVAGNVFSKMDYASVIVPAFGVLPVNNIFVTFSIDTNKPKVLEIIIEADDGFVLKTEMSTNNSISEGSIITRFPSSITQGNALIIKSAMESNL